MDNPKFILWLSLSEPRYFWIPVGQSLPDGDYPIRTLTGKQASVSLEALATWEIPASEAETLAKEEARLLMGSFPNLFNPAAASAGTQSRFLEQLAFFLGIEPQTLQEEPEAGRESLQRVLKGTTAIMEDAVADDPARQERARETLRGLQQQFAKGFGSLPLPLTALPGWLRSWHQQPGNAPKFETLLQKMHEALTQLETPVASGGASITSILESLLQTVKMLPEEETPEQFQARLREQARRDIGTVSKFNFNEVWEAYKKDSPDKDKS